jgi:uncharacterized protein
MKLVDTNVLLYAADRRSLHHQSARSWLERTLASGDPLLLPWVCIVGFIRISTLPSFFPQPLSVSDAMRFVRPLLYASSVIVPEPDARHLDRIEMLLTSLGRAGNLVTDGHLAALALQYDSSVVSYDHDFALFPDVRWERPPPVPND